MHHVAENEKKPEGKYLKIRDSTCVKLLYSTTGYSTFAFIIILFFLLPISISTKQQLSVFLNT